MPGELCACSNVEDWIPNTDPEEADPLFREQPLLAELYAASVHGRIGTGPHAGSYLATTGLPSEPEKSKSKAGSRCANVSGFSLHANVCIPSKARRQLENLCRYVARPAVATERLSVLSDGRVAYQLRHKWRNGATHVIFEPPRNYSWAELLKRVFEIDILECDHCGGRMRILCAINPPDAIRKTAAYSGYRLPGFISVVEEKCST